jgi:hypothetical protein
MATFKRTVTQKPLFELIIPENFTPRGNGDMPAEANTLYRIPEHQRFPAWPTAKKQKLVDSIFKNYPIHAFIAIRHLTIDGDEVTEFCNIEDGQTRMTSLQEYMLDGYPSEAGDAPNDGKLYSELEPTMRERFKNYQVTLEVFSGRGINNDVIADIFNRLNSGKPLGDNDKFHSRMNTPIMDFLNELKVHAELRDNIEKFIGAIGTGKSRKGLGDMVGVILAVATRHEDSGGQACINTSYEQNYKYLKKVLTNSQRNDVIAFFKSYFVMLNRANSSMTARPKKHLYGKLSGVLGLSAFCWVSDGQIRPEIEWYLTKLIQNPKYEPATFRELTKGDIRNCQGASVARRVDKIIIEYNNTCGEVTILSGEQSDNEEYDSDTDE